MTALTDLLARVEKAEGPDVGLDMDIICALFRDPREWCGDPHERGYDPNRSRLTASLDATLALVEELGFEAYRLEQFKHGHSVWVRRADNRLTPTWVRTCRMRQLAALGALLRAKVAEEGA